MYFVIFFVIIYLFYLFIPLLLAAFVKFPLLSTLTTYEIIMYVVCSFSTFCIVLYFVYLYRMKPLVSLCP